MPEGDVPIMQLVSFHRQRQQMAELCRADGDAQ